MLPKNRNFVALCVVVITADVIAVEQPSRSTTTAANEKVLQSFSKPIEGVDWDELLPHYEQMLERVFIRNGWTDEADQYAMKVALRVASIPPWDLAGRLRVLNEEISDRYGLTPQQSAEFQRGVMRELGGFLMRHGPAMWGQAQEALQGRSQGRPYTTDQIAKWAELGKPLFDEIEQSIERLGGELETNLSDEKKGVLRSDMSGFRKRHEAVKVMNERWARGEWKPEEWGLEDDPIQNRAPKGETRPAEVPKAGRVVSPAPPLVDPAVVVAIPSRWIEHDPTTWIALVMEFRKQYSLDVGQMDTAWSIHGELVERALRYSNARKSELVMVPESQRAESAAYKPIRDLFAELRERLESLPTTQQREAGVKK